MALVLPPLCSHITITNGRVFLCLNYREYAKIMDKNTTRCKTPPDRANLPLSELKDVDLLCPYDDECYDCDCCESRDNCSCRAYCFENCLCFHNWYNDIDRMNCTSRNMSVLPPERLSYAKDIFLDGNNFSALESSGLYFPYVERLFLNQSSVSTIDTGAFQFVRKMKLLYLQDNGIGTIERYVFRNLSALAELHLEDNEIEVIENNSFGYLPAVTNLYLHRNRLGVLDVSLFNNMPSLTELTLHGNPWVCDCPFGPAFQTWIKANRRILTPNIDNIYCTARVPENVILEKCPGMNTTELELHNEGVTIHKHILDFDFCFCRNEPIINQEQLVIGLVSMATGFTTVGLLVVVLHVNRLLILVLVYNRFGWRPCWKHEDYGNKRYDVFIAYAPADEYFVVREILPTLEEGEKTYRVRYNIDTFI